MVVGKALSQPPPGYRQTLIGVDQTAYTLNRASLDMRVFSYHLYTFSVPLVTSVKFIEARNHLRVFFVLILHVLGVDPTKFYENWRNLSNTRTAQIKYSAERRPCFSRVRIFPLAKR